MNTFNSLFKWKIVLILATNNPIKINKKHLLTNYDKKRASKIKLSLFSLHKI